jgi:hypothetical protein
METRLSLKDIEVEGEYMRLTKKKLRASDSKFKAALDHQMPPDFTQNYKSQPIIGSIQKYLQGMQASLEEMFKAEGKK